MMKYQPLVIVAIVSTMLFAGCGGSDEPPKIDCSKSDLAVTFESANPESCTVVDGSIIATATGGKAPYTYALNAGSFSSTSNFSNLSGGDYIIRVRDKNGCTIESETIELRIPGSDLTADASAEADTECVGNNGSVTVNATGGTTPYQYKLNNGAFGASETFGSLAPGNYTVTVKDADGCLFPKPVNVLRGDTGTSLEDEIMPIIETKCAVSGCHNGSQSPNLTTAANVRSNATAIKTQTQSGAMPQEGSITAAQKALIACWVDDGAKNN
jgi:hypothetical protein